MSLLGRVYTTLTVLAITGCTSTTEPASGLDVSVALSSQVVQPGEHIELTVSATNRGTRSVPVVGNPCQGVAGAFVVTTADRKVVGPSEAVCAAVAIPMVILAPGEQIEFQASWAGESLQSPVAGPPVFLEPGGYQLRGQILTSSGSVLGAPVAVRVAR